MASDTWQPSASIKTLRQRAKILAEIRSFFVKRDYLEVETPIMAHFGITDPHLANIPAIFRKETFQLQTSPEYHMKRLLAAGSGPIFQLARVFRDDELGRWHNPEFTLLEWYQLGIDHHAMMDEVDDFLQIIMKSGPMQKATYQDIFLKYCDLDPFTSTLNDLRHRLKRFGLDNVLTAQEVNTDIYLFLLMTHVIEPELAKETMPIAIYHFPPSQAALAQVNEGIAERFEVYFKGVELANGFHELINAEAQVVRFKQDLHLRAKLGVNEPPLDNYFIQALNHGLPPCSGVAVGIDRLIALRLGHSSITDTLAFDFSRA